MKLLVQPLLYAVKTVNHVRNGVDALNAGLVDRIVNNNGVDVLTANPVPTIAAAAGGMLVDAFNGSRANITRKSKASSLVTKSAQPCPVI